MRTPAPSSFIAWPTGDVAVLGHLRSQRLANRLADPVVMGERGDFAVEAMAIRRRCPGSPKARALYEIQEQSNLPPLSSNVQNSTGQGSTTSDPSEIRAQQLKLAG